MSRLVFTVLLTLQFALGACTSRPIADRRPSQDATPRFPFVPKMWREKQWAFPRNLKLGSALTRDLAERLSNSVVMVEAYRPENDASDFMANVGQRLNQKARNQASTISIASPVVGALIVGFAYYTMEKIQSKHAGVAGSILIMAAIAAVGYGWAYSSGLADKDPSLPVDTSGLLKRDEVETAAQTAAEFLGALVSLDQDAIQRLKTALVDEVFIGKYTYKIREIDPVRVAERERLIDDRTAKALIAVRDNAKNLKGKNLPELTPTQKFDLLISYSGVLDLMVTDYGHALTPDQREKIEATIAANVGVLNRIVKYGEVQTEMEKLSR